MDPPHKPMESPTERRRRRRRVPDAVRKRASRACDRCKARKNKCVETSSGICVRCNEGSHPCRFDRESDLERGTVADFQPAKTGVTAPISSTRLSNVAAANSEPEQASLKEDFSPAVGAPSEAFVWPRFLSRLRDAFCLDPQTAPQEQELAGLHTHSSQTQSADLGELRRVKKAVRGFPPRVVADFLVSVCIAYGTDVFFYFNQDQFTAQLDEFYSKQSSVFRLDTSFVCLALAVFALGSQWTALARPEDLRDASLREDQNFDPGRIFYDQARVLMSDLIDRSCIRSVQATFILSVYLMPASAISASYVYMGLALRKALAIGLHQETDDVALSSEEKEMRRRLWWSIYSLERTVTIKLNRPRSISQNIISARLPQTKPEDSSQKFDNVQHQIANATFVLIIDKLSQPGAWSKTNKASSEVQPPDSLQNAQSSLKAWKKDLPPSLKLQNVDPKSSSYRAVFHLHLNYYFAWIDMGKVSVVTVVRARLRAVFCFDDTPQTISKAVEQSSDACIRAAKKMLELFEGLRRSGNMARFSFTDFQGCSIATIIVLLSGILDRDSGYEGRVAFGLACLRRMACGGNTTARMGVRFVEALQSITNEARCKLLVAQGAQDDRRSVSAEAVDGYGRWAEWLATADTIQESSGDESDSDPVEGSALDVADEPPLRQTIHSSPWEETPALQIQEIPPSEFAVPMEDSTMAGGQNLLPLPSTENVWLPAFTWSDDQMYLMGLTGMDVLDFTGLC